MIRRNARPVAIMVTGCALAVTMALFFPMSIPASGFVVGIVCGVLIVMTVDKDPYA